MDNISIFQKVLSCLDINSKSEIPKPWSEFCPETFPRIVNSNSKKHNIFKESNREKLLMMISVALCLFTDEDSYLLIPLEYHDIEKTRHEYAKKLMDLIEELCFTDFSPDNMEWVDQVENPDEAFIVFFWFVIEIENWEDIELTYKIKIFQFIYDFYKMLFVLLYRDEECSQDRQNMARECFISILSCDYYYHGLLKPLREIVVAELNQPQNIPDEYLRLLKKIKYAHLKKTIHSISKENCFFGYNYYSVCLIGKGELSSSETALLSLFNKGSSYRLFSNSNTFSIIDVEADIKRLISYNMLVVYTRLSCEVFCKMMSTVFHKSIESYKDIFMRLWNILRNRATKSQIAKVLENTQYMGSDQLIENIYSMWINGAVNFKTNLNDPIVRCENGAECGVRADIETVEKLLRENKCYSSFRNSIECSEQDDDSIRFRCTKIIIALLWEQRILLYTPYNQEEFTEVLEQTIGNLPPDICNKHKPLMEFLVKEAWEFLHKTTDFLSVYEAIETSGAARGNVTIDGGLQARVVLYFIIGSLWIREAIFLLSVPETDDYESAFMKYMLLDYWGDNIPKIVHDIKSKKEKDDGNIN